MRSDVLNSKKVTFHGLTDYEIADIMVAVRDRFAARSELAPRAIIEDDAQPPNAGVTECVEIHVHGTAELLDAAKAAEAATAAFERLRRTVGGAGSNPV